MFVPGKPLMPGIVETEAKALPEWNTLSGAPPLGQAPGFNLKYKTRLKTLSRHNHTSLFRLCCWHCCCKKLDCLTLAIFLVTLMFSNKAMSLPLVWSIAKLSSWVGSCVTVKHRLTRTNLSATNTLAFLRQHQWRRKKEVLCHRDLVSVLPCGRRGCARLCGRRRLQNGNDNVPRRQRRELNSSGGRFGVHLRQNGRRDLDSSGKQRSNNFVLIRRWR